MQTKMQMKLHNIGIIKDSIIDINGLTVIVGHNNSGKTTVGKALFSLLDSVSDLELKITADKEKYIRQEIEIVKTRLMPLTILGTEKINKFLKEYKSIKFLLFDDEFSKKLDLMDLNNLMDLLNRLLTDLYNLDTKKLSDLIFFNIPVVLENRSENQIIKNMIEESINKITQCIENLKIENQFQKYTSEIINKTLNIEFSDQIQTFKYKQNISKIKLSINNNDVFSLDLSNNRISNDFNYNTLLTKYNNVFFIDNPFILDELNQVYKKSKHYSEALLCSDNIMKHAEKLKAIINKKSNDTILEKLFRYESLKELQDDIDEVIPGEFQFTAKDGPLYVHGDQKIKVPNLATGAKIFLILKILLQKGLINENTMLILDEPEAHLHPSWQNKLAEVIALIIKNLGTNILLTTHSSNFVLAIDAYMRKHDITSKVNFYQTQQDNDDKEMVTYHCCNDDLGKIYADYLKYLAEVKNLRDEYIICYEDEC